MITLLIGERFPFNDAHTFDKWATYWQAGGTDSVRDQEYLNLMLDKGTFSGRGRERLSSIGVKYSMSMNLLWPGQDWPRDLARAVASRVKMLLRGEAALSRLIFVGGNVARAFRESAIVGDTWLWLDKKCICVPHPGGRNKWWHNEHNISDMKVVVERWLE
jgi:hypothetical protein